MSEPLEPRGPEEKPKRERRASKTRVLGTNPLAIPPWKPTEPERLEPWLDALDHLSDERALPEETLPAREPQPPRRERGTRGRRQHSDRELPSELRRLASWLGQEPVERLGALLERVDEYDRFGLSALTLRRAFPFFYALYRAYFRVRSQGHEHVPSSGPAVLVANHGGLLPFDGAMAVLDVLLHTDPPRLPRAIVERWAGTLPFVNVFFARVGQVVGTHENFARLLDDGEPVLVFPEGVEGIRKPITQRYRLRPFHAGFVEHALRARAPIVPIAIVGSDDQAPILFDLKPLARLLGVPAAPITPTFPWLGPLGLLPYPVSYRIEYSEPFDFHERFGPEAADDAALVRDLASRVRARVQALLDRSR